MTGLAYMLAITGTPDYAEEAFEGAVLWLRRWEIWSESIDSVGYALLEGLRGKASDRLAIDVAPAMHFDAGEFTLAHAALAVPLLFQWDAIFAPANGAFSAFISHDGYVDVAPGVGASATSLQERFTEWVTR